MSQARAYLQITGRVQGVWYRASAEAKARELGLAGWVRNMPDGSVQAMAEGERANVVALIAWAHDGPVGARVEAVDLRWEEPVGTLSGFRIRA